MGHSLEIDNIIASTAMEGGVLDEVTVAALGQIERGERSAEDVVEEIIARVRSPRSVV